MDPPAQALPYMSEHRTPRLLGLAAVTLAVVVSACVDAPSAPADDVGSGALFFAPQITLVGPAGPATSLAQTGALDETFDRVDRFRMVVRRWSRSSRPRATWSSFPHRRY